MKEIWKPVNGYDGYYEVSNFGKIRSLKRIVTRGENAPVKVPEKVLTKGVFGNSKHKKVRARLCKNKIVKQYLVHRLVAIAFIDNPDKKPYINHIDNNPLNNNVRNLEWVTQAENMQWCALQGRLSCQKMGKFQALKKEYPDFDYPPYLK